MATVEESTQKVQRILVSKFNKVILLEDGFAIERGSTRVKIEIKDFGKDRDGNPDSLVRLWAPMGREIPATPELFRWAATEAQGYRFGATIVYENEDKTQCSAVFAHSLLADFLDPGELGTRSGWSPGRPTTSTTRSTTSSAASAGPTSSRAGMTTA